MRVYFAHPVTDFGSAWKSRMLECIREQLGADVEIVDPDTDEHAACYRARGMTYFEDVVAGCDLLVFARFPLGRIGAGVAREIDAADVLSIPVHEISRLTGGLSRCYPREDQLAWDYMTVDETRARIREIKGVMA